MGANGLHRHANADAGGGKFHTYNEFMCIINLGCLERRWQPLCEVLFRYVTALLPRPLLSPPTKM